MPTVQYRDEVRKVNITKAMDTPKRITNLDHWFKAARKAIPEIPQLHTANGHSWFIEYTETSVQWINFHLRNGLGERVYVVIDRTASRFTR